MTVKPRSAYPLLLLDPEDEYLLHMYNWCTNAYGYYWRRRLVSDEPGTAQIYLHRSIGNLQECIHMHSRATGLRLQADHINGNRIDNRRENLRIVTQQGNNHNRTRARGYHWCRAGRCWKAKIALDCKNIHLGCYGTAEEARAAYESAKQHLHVIREFPWN